ncbi:protein PLASTID MOVEMENT IMPAIRED 1-RELATED 1-like [Salvia splendens]|uniref:protein PLASTID MOVEMENT IMPAIRED 1-RELATED 1-like n=1 Tax=Salvia splendens TaxID=180675 RepID=UPI001C2687D2|nr:protein PLASTID MOVEMENT IMPAIRED 1-RELATED 1-like [Salvia splendens]
MLSKADGRKKIDEVSQNGRFANDLELISKALFADRQQHRLSSSSDAYRSEAVRESPMPEHKIKAEKAKADKRDSVEKEKKPSIWSWRGLKAWTSGRNRRFSCHFSLLVHSIQGLPSLFDDVCLVVHWKRQDGELMTSPNIVHEGVANFEEELIHSCSVNVSKGTTKNLAKYEAKNYLLYASVYNAPELDLGKHHIDLTRLLPLTLEELEDEKSSGKWATSFRLSGKAGGATMNVSFGYIVVGKSREPSSKNNTPGILNRRENRAMTESFVDQSHLKDDLILCRVGSLPATLDTLKQSEEDIKELHEILPMPTSELYQSVNELYQKLDEEMPNASVENKLDTDPFPSHLDSYNVNSFKPPDADEKNTETERETGEFTVTEKGIEEFTRERMRSEEDPCKVALASGEVTETDGVVEVTLNKEDILHPSANDAVYRKHEKSIRTCSSVKKENAVLSKESLMKELEMALSYASNLMNEELESQEDENETPFEDSFSKEKPPNMDDITDSVANDFLKMLNVESSPFGFSSTSEPDSPRERLLREFERDALANGGILNFDIEDDPIESVSNVPKGSAWEAMSNDFYQSSILEGFRETSQMESNVSSRRASRLEDLETEALMRDWGMNEKAFQHSPSSKSDGFCNPVGLPPKDLDQQLVSEGLGPILQTKNGGFLRSMNPALFRNAKGGGSLIMQASSPVVVPAEMGSGVMDILQGLAVMGIEKLSMQANKLMPLEDITGKTIQQIAWEAAPSTKRQGLSHDEFEIMQNICNGEKRGEGTSSGQGLGKCGSTLLGADTEYVSLEDLAPSAMDKIEALSIEGLRVQSGMTDEDAPSNISTQSFGKLSALKGKGVDISGTIGLDGAGGLQLLDIKDKCDNVDGLMSLSLTLDEWMKLDSGEIDDDDLVSERTSRLLAAHHATSLDLFRGKSKGEKRRGRGRKYGLLGNSFTVALMVQLRDPLRNYEPVGNPMLALIQVERVFVPPRPKIYRTVPLARNSSEEEKESRTATNENITGTPTESINCEEELIPQYKINEVHVAGLKMEQGKKKLWGSQNQQQSGSRWLLGNGMGKKNKHPLMKSKAVVKNSSPASSSSTTTVQPGDTLWSISSRVHGTGAKWKDLAALNPHIRNPNVILPNETIRLR